MYELRITDYDFVMRADVSRFQESILISLPGIIRAGSKGIISGTFCELGY